MVESVKLFHYTTTYAPERVSALISDDELVTRFRDRQLDHDSAAHFRGRLEQRLLIHRCRDCGTWHHPPMPVCPSCWSTEVEATEVAGTGTIHLAVFLHQGPPAPGVDYTTPYPVVTVELDEQPGLRFTSTVVDASNDDVVIGRRVSLDWIERAGVPLPVFRLETTDR
jgi:uncharacterized OB-fold protein